MDNVINFPGSTNSQISKDTQPVDDSKTNDETFKKDGTITKAVAEVLKENINGCLDEGVKDLVFYVVTKKGRTLVTITKDTDKLVGMVSRIQHSLLANDCIHMDEYYPEDFESDE